MESAGRNVGIFHVGKIWGSFDDCVIKEVDAVFGDLYNVENFLTFPQR